MESRWGQETEEIDVRLNVEQAEFTRDAWVKDLYVRLFEYLSNCEILFYNTVFILLSQWVTMKSDILLVTLLPSVASMLYVL